MRFLTLTAGQDERVKFTGKGKKYRYRKHMALCRNINVVH